MTKYIFSILGILLLTTNIAFAEVIDITSNLEITNATNRNANWQLDYTFPNNGSESVSFTTKYGIYPNFTSEDTFAVTSNCSDANEFRDYLQSMSTHFNNYTTEDNIWLAINCSTTGNLYYAQFSWTGSQWTNPIYPPSGTNNYLEWINPATSTASTTFNVEYEYYLDENEISTTTFTGLALNICPINQEGECYWEGINGLTYGSIITGEITVTDYPYVAFQLGTLNIWNGVEENTSCSWWEFWCEEENYIVGIGDSSKFNVASTTYQVTYGANKQTVLNACDDNSNIATEGICRTLLWLFYPEDGTEQTFLNFTSQIANKVPFGYINLLDQKVNSINATSSAWNTYTLDLSSTTQYSLGNIQVFDWTHAKETIGEENLNTIASWIVNIMWIAFGVYLVARIIMITQKI